MAQDTKRRAKKKGPPVTSDTKAPIVMVVTMQEDGNIGARAYGWEHQITNEDLLGLVGVLAATIIVPTIDEHGYDPGIVPMSLELIRSGMEQAFLEQLGGTMEIGRSRIIVAPK